MLVNAQQGSHKDPCIHLKVMSYVISTLWDYELGVTSGSVKQHKCG